MNTLLFIKGSPAGFCTRWRFLFEAMGGWLGDTFLTLSFPSPLLVSILLQGKVVLVLPLWFTHVLTILVYTHGFLFNLFMSFILKLRLSQIQPGESLQTGSCAPDTAPSLCEHALLAPGGTGLSSGSLAFDFLQWRRIIFRDQDLDARFVHCYWGVTSESF